MAAKRLLIVKATTTTKASETRWMQEITTMGYVIDQEVSPSTLTQAMLDASNIAGVVVLPTVSPGALTTGGTTIYQPSMPKPVLFMTRGGAAAARISTGHSARGDDEVEIRNTKYSNGLAMGVHQFYQDINDADADGSTTDLIIKSTQYVTTIPSGSNRVCSQPAQAGTSTGVIIETGGLNVDAVPVAAPKGFYGVNDTDADYVYLHANAFTLFRGFMLGLFGIPVQGPTISGPANQDKATIVDIAAKTTGATSFSSLTLVSGPTPEAITTLAPGIYLVDWPDNWSSADADIVLSGTASNADGSTEFSVTIPKPAVTGVVSTVLTELVYIPSANQFQ